jgi:hypothetical protein
LKRRRHFEREFADWLYDALAGRSQTDWLPRWNPPHELIELEPGGFDA